jgi:uncharacterized protein HemY
MKATRILSVVLHHVTLRGKDGAESDFAWHPPFDILFAIGGLAFKNAEWGKPRVLFKALLMNHARSPQIAALGAAIAAAA